MPDPSKLYTAIIEGDLEGAVALAKEALEQFYDLVRKGYPLYPPDIQRGVEVVSASAGTRLADVFLDTVFVTSGKRRITPKNLNQKSRWKSRVLPSLFQRTRPALTPTRPTPVTRRC